MVEAGSLSITGSIDTSLIERGFSRIKKSFDRVKSSAKSFGSDMVRISQSTATLAKSLGLIATTGLAAIVGLAKNAPAVAPAMAKIGVEFDRLTRVIGEQLQPYFDKFSEAFTKFVSFVDAHPDLTKGFALTAGALTGILALTKFVNALGGTITPGMLAALGYAGAIVGAGYAGAKAAEFIADKTTGFFTSEAEQIPGTLQSSASVDQSAAEIAAAGFQPTPDGVWSAAQSEDIRKWIVFRWWDSIWS